jgi:hypothetical protein
VALELLTTFTLGAASGLEVAMIALRALRLTMIVFILCCIVMTLLAELPW